MSCVRREWGGEAVGAAVFPPSLEAPSEEQQFSSAPPLSRADEKGSIYAGGAVAACFPDSLFASPLCRLQRDEAPPVYTRPIMFPRRPKSVVPRWVVVMQ